MFGNNIFPDDFWKLDGTQKVFLSWEVPRCADGCPNNWIHDGYCDSACNNIQCDWDGGDCLDKHGRNTGSSGNTKSGNGGSTGSSAGGGSKGTDKSRYCASGCPVTWVGDKVCDRACTNADCGWDGGDCGYNIIKENKMYGKIANPNDFNHSIVKIPKDIANFYIDFGNLFL